MATPRVVALVVATPLLLQHLDSSVMSTALPEMARALGVGPLELNLAITSYLLSLAIFLPLSGWAAERFGARRVFCWAVAIFACGSALCAAADRVSVLVACRVVQGLGGALMVPVARLLLLRGVPNSGLITAMVWFSLPAVLGRMMGPVFGALIVSFASWRWIFLINVPVGIAAIALALRLVDETMPTASPDPFDVKGFVLLACALSAFLLGFETLASAALPAWLSVAGASCGVLLAFAYWRHSRRHAFPLIDLRVLRVRTYMTAVIGGMPLRVGVGASPFLLPLLLQIGFGLSPLTSGTLTLASALGSLVTRPVLSSAIGKLGFRSLLLAATTGTSIAYAGYALFTAETPHFLIFLALLVGGLINSMAVVAMGTLGYSDLPSERMSHATTFAAMCQQLSVAVGVVLGATSVGMAAELQGRDTRDLAASDFAPAFLIVSVVSALSLCWFARLHPSDGASMRTPRKERERGN